jgi:predicted ATPase/DNA-binding response OmpR family regulator
MSPVLVFPAVRIDLERRWVESADGQRERLTSLEARVLRYLAERSERVVGRDELLTEVWGYSVATVSRACDNTIRRLRTKIELDPAEPEWLLTVHGTGYQLVSSPRQEQTVPAPAQAGPGRRCRLGPRTVDLDRARIEGPDGLVALTSNELVLLGQLFEAGGRAVDRGTLSRRVWGHGLGRPLDNAVARLRKKLEPDPARPQYLLTTAGGYRLELGEAPAERPSTTTGNLPPELDLRVGREGELADILVRVDSGARLLTLLGPGGIGKTRLALAAARQLALQRRCTAWWFDLTDAHDETSMLASMARGLGIPLGADDPSARVSSALAALGPAVVVLDNLEQLARIAAPAISVLVGAAPELVILCTSRVLLRLRGERRLELAPLPEADGITLFLDRAIRPPSEAELTHIAPLVQALEGLPLAIELAAASTRVLAVGEILQRTDDCLRLLVSGTQDRRERYRSLRASLDSSWELLPPWARAALAQLSVFRGGFTIEAAEQILELGPWPEASWTLDVVQELVDASLVQLAPDGSRFSMLQTVREYASERLGTDPPLEQRHGRYYAALGDPAALDALEGPDEIERHQELVREHGNLVAACERALQRRDLSIAGPTACAAWVVFERLGPCATGFVYLEQALELGASEARVVLAAGQAATRVGRLEKAERWWVDALERAQDPREEGRVRVKLAALHRLKERHEPARVQVERALALAGRDEALECAVRLEQGNQHKAQLRHDEAARSFALARHLAHTSGARSLRAEVASGLARLERDRGRPAEAAALLAEALAGARDTGDLRLEAMVLSEQGTLERERGRPREAREKLAVVLELQRRIGDRLGEMVTSGNLASACSLLRRYDEAEPLFHATLRLARQLGMVRSEISALANLANLHSRQLHIEETERLNLAALALAREHGDLASISHVACNLANLYTGLLRWVEAAALYEEALELQRRLGLRADEGVTLGQWANLARMMGEHERAKELNLAALAIHQQTGNTRFEAMVKANLARSSLAEGDLPQARAYLDDAVRQHRSSEDPLNLGRALLTLAELEHTRGCAAEARAAFEEARALLEAREQMRIGQVGELLGLVQPRTSR